MTRNAGDIEQRRPTRENGGRWMIGLALNLAIVSALGVIEQFEDAFPGIDVIVTWTY